jgi:hypothetical protein
MTARWFRVFALLAGLASSAPGSTPPRVRTVQDEGTPPIRTLTCYTSARLDTTLDDDQRFLLCQGANTAAPVMCFNRARIETTLDTRQSIVLCRCAFDTSPIDCWEEGRTDLSLESDEIVGLCSTIVQYQLYPNCLPVWGAAPLGY